MKKLFSGVVLAAFVGVCAGQDRAANEFITLGTAGGPPSGNSTRSQPSNLLQVADRRYLVDVGDGTVAQLEKLGIQLVTIDAVFISHLHFDHTGGLLALLGLRMQLDAPNTLTVYGPDGAVAFVDGLLAAMAGSMDAAYGIPGQSWTADVVVVELSQGSVVELEGMTVTAAENTHYSVPGDPAAPPAAASLSYRFDLANRSIVYSGDTGPSAALASLAEGADVLICEMMDVDAVLANVRRLRPNLPVAALGAIEAHLRAHHVTPSQVGELGASAEVARLVITHMAPSVNTQTQEDMYRAEIGRAFSGPVVFADDLERF